MDSSIKPIETVYAGYRFRSRLEARYAVLMDELHVKYEYEPEGFDLGDGVYYLPDFWLPDLHWWVEIKPNLEDNQYAWVKPSLLAQKGRVNVALFCGLPGVTTKLQNTSYAFKCLDDDDNGRAFIGDHTLLPKESYLDFIAGRSTFRSLATFLCDKQKEKYVKHCQIPAYDETEDTARALIAIDKEYYQEKYAKDHWQWGNMCDRIGWRSNKGRFTIDWCPEDIDSAVADAYTAARQARFDHRGR